MLVTSSTEGVPVLEAERHRIGLRWRNGCKDIFQIQFHGNVVFVHFPYQPNTPGVISRKEFPPGTNHTFEVTDSADAMTRKVKYSHPVDGKAHFSQDGQIKTTVWNQANRLDISIGHFFSLDVAGIDLFRNSKNVSSTGTVSTQFSFDSDHPVDPVHFAGYWLRGESNYRPAGLINPVMLKQHNGQLTPMLAVAPPPGSPLQGCLLAVSIRPGFDAMRAKEGNFYLMFTGGFAENLSNEHETSSFLTMQYPVEDISALPVVDYQKEVPELLSD